MGAAWAQNDHGLQLFRMIKGQAFSAPLPPMLTHQTFTSIMSEWTWPYVLPLLPSHSWPVVGHKNCVGRGAAAQ